MSGRLSVITDWRVRNEDDLLDIEPGAVVARVIAPQKFIVLHQIRVVGTHLIRLEIGMVTDVPFELESTDGPVRIYRLKDLGNDDDLNARLIKTGAAVATPRSIAIAPALEVRTILRNEGKVPTKPRAALLVQEEGR